MGLFPVILLSLPLQPSHDGAYAVELFFVSRTLHFISCLHAFSSFCNAFSYPSLRGHILCIIQ